MRQQDAITLSGESWRGLWIRRNAVVLDLPRCSSAGGVRCFVIPSLFFVQVGNRQCPSSWVATLTFVVGSFAGVSLSAGAATPPAAHYSGYQTTLGSGFSFAHAPCRWTRAGYLRWNRRNLCGDGVIYEIVAVNGVASASSQIKTLFSDWTIPTVWQWTAAATSTSPTAAREPATTDLCLRLLHPTVATPNVITLSNAYINPTE